jgi:hypothetical protein
MGRCFAPTGSTVGVSEGGVPPETPRRSASRCARHFPHVRLRPLNAVSDGRLKQRTHCRFSAAASFLLASLRCGFALISERRVPRAQPTSAAPLSSVLRRCRTIDRIFGGRLTVALVIVRYAPAGASSVPIY